MRQKCAHFARWLPQGGWLADRAADMTTDFPSPPVFIQDKPKTVMIADLLATA